MRRSVVIRSIVSTDVQVGAARAGGAEFCQYVPGAETVGSGTPSIVGRG
jgi:hypothetical protein